MQAPRFRGSRLAAMALAAVVAVFGLQATAGRAAALSICSTSNCSTVIVSASGGGSGTVSRILTLTRTGTGTGTIGVGSTPCNVYPCVLEEAYGTVVNIVIAPTAGSVFKGWSGACAGQGTQCLLSMTTNQTTSARFDLPSAATPAPGTAKPTATPGPSTAGTSPTADVLGSTTEPSASASPSPAASATPSAAAPGGSDGLPLLPIIAAVVLALVVVGYGAFQLGARRSRP